MARRERQSPEQIKALILNAAETLVSEEGFAALTARKLAVESGYTVGSIYMVFSHMDDLTAQLKLKILDRLVADLLAIADSETAEQQLFQMVDCYRQFTQNHTHCWRLVFEPHLKIPSDFCYSQPIQPVLGRISLLLWQLNPSKNAEQSNQAAATLWGCVHGICVLSLMNADGESQTANSLALLLQTFLAGWCRIEQNA